MLGLDYVPGGAEIGREVMGFAFLLNPSYALHENAPSY